MNKIDFVFYLDFFEYIFSAFFKKALAYAFERSALVFWGISCVPRNKSSAKSQSAFPSLCDIQQPRLPELCSYWRWPSPTVQVPSPGVPSERPTSGNNWTIFPAGVTTWELCEVSDRGRGRGCVPALCCSLMITGLLGTSTFWLYPLNVTRFLRGCWSHQSNLNLSQVHTLLTCTCAHLFFFLWELAFSGSQASPATIPSMKGRQQEEGAFWL